MKLYDISQELFSCTVYPGDPKPERRILSSTASGDLYNLTAFSMCAHNGTHVDAPFHFLEDGKTLDQLDLEVFVGDCFVARHTGNLTATDTEEILRKAGSARRILIAGDVTVTDEAAEVFADSGICLLGNESQSVGPENAPMAVHKLLLGRQIALLEGIRLEGVPEGRYFLCAAPLNLAGADGAPCRAFLVDFNS
ncbi:MAG: cyclase family protein [Oscillospiraceae bacterium]|nr:cyclase family protein [Oscillospiraceae bacterium]